MYQCQRCGKQSEPRQGQFKVVVETRQRTYFGGKNGQDIVGEGHEIVRELVVGKCCATKESVEEKHNYA
jgi:hypothetical protein